MKFNSLFRNTPSVAFLFLLMFFTIPQANAQFEIHSVYGNLDECDTMTRSIYIVWWDKDFNYTDQVDVMLDSMISYRSTCLDELFMLDPPNTDDGYFYNVYIHTPGNPNCIFYPYGWGNGQGTDPNGYPFLTLPNGTFNDFLNTAHETFHIFQYNANSPGFAYSGDSQWYIEAAANWFAGKENLTAPRAFVEAESLVRMPHVPLWLSYDNYPPTYPSNWQRYVHQYAMALLLFYLTDVEGVPDVAITEGFFNGTTLTPQEYFYTTMGGSTFRNHFINWAAHMTNDFDFITPVQAATNLNEWNTYADPLDDNEFVLELDTAGTNGWFTPADSLLTTAWSFNTYKVTNAIIGTFTFEINGEALGSYGDDAYFQGKVLVQNSETGSSFHDLEMTNDTEGSLILEVTAEDTELFFIVASMPAVFEDSNPSFQLFPYQVMINATTLTGIPDHPASVHKKEVARYNLQGQKVISSDGGIQLIQYDNGQVEKVFNK